MGIKPNTSNYNKLITIQQSQHKMNRLTQVEQSQPEFPTFLPRYDDHNKTFNGKLIGRLASNKRHRVSAVNQNIKLRTTNGNSLSIHRQTSKQQKFNSSSLQLPLNFLRSDIKLNQRSNLSQGLGEAGAQILNVFLGTRTNFSTKARDKTIASFKSNNSKRSRRQRQRQRQRYSPQSQSVVFREKMRKLSLHLNEQKLSNRLRMFSKQYGKSSIRVYKEDIHKMIVHRFSKDRITILLDTQYIQDFNSILNTMKEMVNLKRSEVLVLTFLIMDQNKDGFITPDDLLSLIGTKKQTQSAYNQMVMHNILQILDYIQRQKQKGNQIMDSTTNNILKDEGLTFMKYRINHMKTKKKQMSGEDVAKNGVNSGRMKNYLFSLQVDEQNSLQNWRHEEKFDLKNIFFSILSNTKNKKTQKNEILFEGKENFCINFDRFSEIMGQNIPKIFLDFLYLLGGLQVPGEKYLPIDNSVLRVHASEQKKMMQEYDRLQIVRRRLQNMNFFKKQFRVQKMRTQP